MSSAAAKDELILQLRRGLEDLQKKLSVSKPCYKSGHMTHYHTVDMTHSVITLYCYKCKSHDTFSLSYCYKCKSHDILIILLL